MFITPKLLPDILHVTVQFVIAYTTFAYINIFDSSANKIEKYASDTAAE